MSSELESIDKVEDCLEAHLCRHSKRTSTIYWAVLFLVCSALAALPLIRVGVSIEAPGVIRPAVDMHELVAGTAGFIGEMLASENQVVAAGDPLITILAEDVESRMLSLAARIDEAEANIRDLSRLIGEAEPGTREPLLETPRYREELRLYQSELSAIDLRAERLSRELERSTRLSSLDLIPLVEVEEQQLALSSTVAERATLEARQLSEWRAQLAALAEARLDMLDQRIVLAADSSLHAIRAPIGGTVEQLTELSRGSYVRAGQTLALISPNADLVAEVLVPSSRFGLIRLGMPVRLLIDAYDYVEWGFISGRVAELPNDYVLVDGTPMFRTLVSMTTTYLDLSNGTRRKVGKGLTLRARFMVAERSLWNLIRDDLNDWFNPLQQPD